jgi:hypothetical protein
VIEATLHVGSLEKYLGGEFKNCRHAEWQKNTNKFAFQSGDEVVNANYLVITKTQVVAAQFLLGDESAPSRHYKLADLPGHMNFRNIKVRFGTDKIIISDSSELFSLAIKEEVDGEEPDATPRSNLKPALIFIVADGLILHHFELPPFATKTLTT